MKRSRLWLTTGEPAGIGPDLALDFARAPLDTELVLVGDPALLRERAGKLGLNIEFDEWHSGIEALPQMGRLWVYPVPLRAPAIAGQLDPKNAPYVLDMLRIACDACSHGEADALVTAPVHKGVIADAGHPFTGHTEFLAQRCGGTPVMMLAAKHLRVALATTHLPLREVANAITMQGLLQVLHVLHHDLQQRFAIAQPKIRVCGLNPHAGEGGHLGNEETDIIIPAIKAAAAEGINVAGPLPADTLLTPARWSEADVVLAMYHDQGLPPLKFAGFGHGVNITLGLSIIRTSVDHGTALDLAGSGRASPGSLRAAAEMAAELVQKQRGTQDA